MSEKQVGAVEKNKYHFTEKGNTLTNQGLIDYVLRDIVRFPHLKNAHLEMIGNLGTTGVVITNGHGEIVAAVRSPFFIPRSLDGVNAEFGGTQCDVHIERSLERPADPAEVVRKAKRIIHDFSASDGTTYHELSEEHQAFGAGSEPEGWGIDQHGRALPIHGGELNKGCIEDQIDPVATPLDFLSARAEHILARKQRYGKEAIIIDTSVMPTSQPDAMKIADEGPVGHYIKAMQNRLHTAFMHCNDPYAEQVMSTIARNYGYTDFFDLQKQMGTMAYWAVSASHVSIGLPHRRTGREGMWVPETEAIAVSDFFNSDLATVASLLMFSTPVMFNSTPMVTYEGKDYWPRDYRAIARYTADTSFPAAFIGSPEVLHDRIKQAIVGGMSHTIDRASYIAEVNGVQYPCMHGRVRNRMATSEPKNQSGRVEFTDCSASPSIYDEAARNAFLQVMTIGAYEALAHGQMPQDYFAKAFPHAGAWHRQKDLAIAAATVGFQHEPVKQLIYESLHFLRYMHDKYPVLRQHIALAANRITNLLQPSVDTLVEYTNNPRGPISEVIQKEIQREKGDIVEVMRHVEKMQLSCAQNIINSSA